MKLKLLAKDSNTKCPICKDDLTQPIWRCSNCKTSHHRYCALNTNKCSSLGCNNRITPTSYGVNQDRTQLAIDALNNGISEIEVQEKYGKAALHDALSKMR